MALVLGVRVGGKVRIGSKETVETDKASILTLTRVRSLHEEVGVDVDGTDYTITDKQTVEVLPRVRVSLGTGQRDFEQEYVRLVFDAPFNIRILRDEIADRPPNP